MGGSNTKSISMKSYGENYTIIHSQYHLFPVYTQLSTNCMHVDITYNNEVYIHEQLNKLTFHVGLCEKFCLLYMC